MIQRKQTIYLLLATILNIVCLSLPIGTLHYKTMLPDASVYNFMILNTNGDGNAFTVSVLFVMLLLSSVVSIFTIFAYKNRKRQMKMCSISRILNALWVIAYVIFYFVLFNDDTKTFSISMYSVLPIISIILMIFAHKGIKHDEMLVKAADRIR